MELCECAIGDSGLRTDVLAKFGCMPLEDGGHTAFMLLRCKRCGKIRGFPEENLALFLQDGEPSVIRGLEEEFHQEA